MQVKVLFFGQIKEVVGAPEEQVELPEGASVADLFARYQQRFPRLEEFRPSIAVAVNQEYTDSTAALRTGDEVAFLPPVSGGAADVVELTREPIAAQELVAQVKAPQSGAVVVFDGIVRNHSGQRQTVCLDYQAYEPMAASKMREIVGQVRARFALDGVVLVHRLGRLQVGETSVLIAVSAPHRAAAFDACRFIIEHVKHDLPIWKKEQFADGTVWVEGEPPASPMDAVPVRQES